MNKIAPMIWVSLVFAGLSSFASGAEDPGTISIRTANGSVVISGADDMHHCPPHEEKDTKEKGHQPSCHEHHPTNGVLTSVPHLETSRSSHIFIIPTDDLPPIHHLNQRGSINHSPQPFHGVSPPLLYLIQNVFLL